MDPFTQRLLERTRQRRDVLEKKMADAAVPRKRPMPLGESQEENLPSSYEDESKIDDDSPKRQCVRNPDIHIDTPAIQSVRSRRDNLSALKAHQDTGMDDYVPPLHRAPQPELPVCPIVDNATQRKSRFAALANHINNWEDDLSHPRIKPEEKPKKVWQPPQPNTSEAAGPAKPPRSFVHYTSKPNAPAPPVTPSPTKKIRAPEPPVQSPMKAVKSPIKSVALNLPVKADPASASRVVSQITVTLGGENVEAKQTSVHVTPAPSHTVHVVPAARKENKPETAAQPATVKLSSWQSKSQQAHSMKEEPESQPMSARKAVWEQRVNEASNKKETQTPAKSLVTQSSIGVVMRNSPGRHDEPTEKPVATRMSLWEKKVQEANEEVEMTKASMQKLVHRERSPTKVSAVHRDLSPHKAPSKSPSRPPRTPSSSAIAAMASDLEKKLDHSPVKSPSGPATRTIQDRLNQMQEGWKNNEIAEKMKSEREKELEALQNRWKDGILQDNAVQAPPSSDTSNIPPPPPPLPANGQPITPTNNKAQATNKTPRTTGKNEEYRQRIREELLSSQGKKGDGSLPHNFENKLMAMGFDVHSSSNLGHVATLDLRAQKEMEKQQEQNKPTVQNKVATAKVNIMETKITTTTFGNDKVTVTKTPVFLPEDEKFREQQRIPEQKNAVSTYKTQLVMNQPSTPKPAAVSIYNLIKKTPGGTTVNSTPSYTTTAGQNHQDSFDSSFEDGPETPPREHVQRKVSFASTASSQSEYSEYSETQTEDCDETEAEGYTETDEYTTENNTSQEEDQGSEYSDEYSDEEGEGVDSLLDEAMDDTALDTEPEPEPVPAPRRPIETRAHQHATRPPTYPNMVKNKSPERPVTFHSVQRVRFAADTSSESDNRSTASSESEYETRQPAISVDIYRQKDKNKTSHPAPQMTIVRQSQRYEEPEEPLPYIPEKSVKQKLQELQELIHQEQNIIMQTSNALNKCCGATSNFAGSTEAIECHRLLLIACKRREAYIIEMQRLREGTPEHGQGMPSGSLTISDIRLPLKKDFIGRIGSTHDTTVHYFIGMIRNGAHTIVTQMVSTHDALVRGFLDIPNLFKLKDIPQDFKLDLEIYSMSVTRDIAGQTPKKKSKGLTPKKLLGFRGSKNNPHLQSPGGPTAVRTTNFVLVASLPLSMRCLNKSHFTLEHVPMSSPLQGTIHLRLTCLMEASIEERGFLTMFEDVSGFGAWHRRWCVLENNRLAFWKYPSDEKIKEPMGSIDLKSCITDTVGLIPRDICARPNTFEVVTMRRQQKGDIETLTTRCSNTVSSTRHMLSADTKEDRVIWCDRLNEALKSLRTWHPDALRPIKLKAPNPFE